MRRRRRRRRSSNNNSRTLKPFLSDSVPVFFDRGGGFGRRDELLSSLFFSTGNRGDGHPRFVFFLRRRRRRNVGQKVRRGAIFDQEAGRREHLTDVTDRHGRWSVPPPPPIVIVIVIVIRRRSGDDKMRVRVMILLWCWVRVVMILSWVCWAWWLVHLVRRRLVVWRLPLTFFFSE